MWLLICKVKYVFTVLDSVDVCKLSLIKQFNDFLEKKKKKVNDYDFEYLLISVNLMLLESKLVSTIYAFVDKF